MANPVADESGSSSSSSRPAGAGAEHSRRGARRDKDGSEGESLSLRLETGNICSEGEGLGQAGVEGTSGGRRGEIGGAENPTTRKGSRTVGAGIDGGEGGGWYSVSPGQGVLLPGEKREMRFTVLVSDARGQAGNYQLYVVMQMVVERKGRKGSVSRILRCWKQW